MILYFDRIVKKFYIMLGLFQQFTIFIYFFRAIFIIYIQGYSFYRLVGFWNSIGILGVKPMFYISLPSIYLCGDLLLVEMSYASFANL